MRVIICGGRDYTNANELYQAMNTLNRTLCITEVIHGDARGADKLGGQWARATHIPVIAVPADWDTHGKSAGYKRNIKMADMKPDAVVAFPGGRGTEMMIEIAKQRGIQVYRKTP